MSLSVVLSRSRALLTSPTFLKDRLSLCLFSVFVENVHGWHCPCESGSQRRTDGGSKCAVGGGF